MYSIQTNLEKLMNTFVCLFKEAKSIACKLLRDVTREPLSETKNIGAQIRNKLPDFLLNEYMELDLSKLAEALETNSLKSIREKWINVFAFLKELFRHTKKVFYVVTMCLMITDGYK